jgi:16S rRNA processing protein RimM
VAEPTVVVGKVTKAHGVRGEVTVLVISQTPERFDDGATVWLEDGRELRISSTRPDRGRLLVSFEGVGDRASAEELRGLFLVVPESMLPELPEGSYWPHQLEGAEIVTEGGRSLGALTEVVEHPANDLWVARASDGHETLVPAIREVVVSVDVSGRRIVVRDLPGLTVPDPDEA